MRGYTHVLATDGLDHIIGRRAEEVCDDGKLVDMVLAWEEWLALEHFSKDAACAPDVNFDIVLLPREHDLRGAVVSCRDISSHLRVLNTSQAKIANLEIAVLVDKNVAGLQVTMNNTSRVHVLQSTLFDVS